MRADQRFSPIPVVLISGNPVVKDDAASLGAAAWATKPISLVQLLALSRKFCTLPASG